MVLMAVAGIVVIVALVVAIVVTAIDAAGYR